MSEKAVAGTETGERFAGLDGLRALAVAVVVWHNYGDLPGLAAHPLLANLRAGYVGVILFFVLSGFLISSLLLAEWDRTGGIRIRAFYLRRAARLLPALALTIAFLIALGLARHAPWHDLWTATLAAGFYVYNLVSERASPTHGLGGFGWDHLWSLSVEEQFYLVWPLTLIVMVRRMSRTALAVVVIAAGVLVSAWRTHLWLGGASEPRLYLLTDTRVDAILFGAGLAILLREYPVLRRWSPRFSWLLLPALVTFVGFADLGSHAGLTIRPGWMFGPGMFVVSVLSMVLIWLVIDAPAGIAQRLCNSRVATTIGTRSYGIYLFHLPIYAWLGDRRGGFVISVAATLVAAEISYRFVEQPILRRVPAWARSTSTPIAGSNDSRVP